jgi:hypothetical protein
LYEQDAQVTIAALGYLAEDGAVSGRDLPRHQPEPGSEIAALGEHFAIADRRHHGARDDWPDSRHRHQTLARRVFLHERAVRSVFRPAATYSFPQGQA